MNIKLSKNKINNETVRPIKGAYDDPRPVYGADLFPDVYADIGIIAPQGSGKTTTIAHVLRKCAMPSTKRRAGTIVIFFVGQIYSDPTYKSILRMLNSKGIPFIINNSIYEEVATQRGKTKYVDSLRSIIKYLKNLNKDDYSEFVYQGEMTDDDIESACGSDDDSDDDDTLMQTPREDRLKLAMRRQDPSLVSPDYDIIEETVIMRADPKCKYQYPEIIFVCDDLSDEMKVRSITSLLKEERHMRAKVILASQDWRDFARSGRNQFNQILLFPDLAEDRIFAAYKDLGLRIPWAVFFKCYIDATARLPSGKKSHSFLYVDVRRNSLRKDFSTEYDLDAVSAEITGGRAVTNPPTKFFPAHSRASIQSILFEKTGPHAWLEDEAAEWLVAHGFLADVDEKPEHWRFRQRDPEEFIEGSLRTSQPHSGIKFIFGRLPK